MMIRHVLPPVFSRRRFIGISAAAAGLALLPLAGRSASSAGRLRIWRGVALGADAMLQLHHPDPAEADRLIAASLDEVHRLEAVFSLYRPDSALSRLNRNGVLEEPPPELVELCAASQGFARLTGGAFDPTVQPLWDLYAAHFSAPDADPAGPGPDAIAAALRRVGWQAMQVDPARIRLLRPGMALTLNGIAQGYVTDRIVRLLRGGGIDRSLVDMGEIRAIGARPDGGPWIVGIENPAAPGVMARRLAIEGIAVSTSGAYGTMLDPAGRFNHLFDPATGGSAWRYRSVTVLARDSTTADALSTAFSLMQPEATQRVVSALRLTAHFALPDGSWRTQMA